MSPLTAGQPWVTINTIFAAASIAALAATTISQFKARKNNNTPGYASGKYPGLQTGMYGDKAHYALFNEVPGYPEMVVDGITTRKMQVNYPQIEEAIYAIRDGRRPAAFADGKYPASSAPGSSPSAGDGSFASDPTILSKLDDLNRNIANLKIYTTIEDIRKGDKKFSEIQNTRGL
jgi:hypothetical protein